MGLLAFQQENTFWELPYKVVLLLLLCDQKTNKLQHLVKNCQVWHMVSCFYINQMPVLCCRSMLIQKYDRYRKYIGCNVKSSCTKLPLSHSFGAENCKGLKLISCWGCYFSHPLSPISLQLREEEGIWLILAEKIPMKSNSTYLFAQCACLMAHSHHFSLCCSPFFLSSFFFLFL